jgi:1-acyl-sn-glycerol-3-phosphate acyltransferase
MLHSASHLSEVRVVTKHSGFIRMALQEGAHLVPVLSFGEIDLMDNIRMPAVQQWFLRHTGIAAPHNPYGLFYLPIPRPRKVTVVVGAPIPVERVAEPTDALVKQTMDVYMRALLDMYEKHRVAAGERLDRRLVLLDGKGQEYQFGDISVVSTKGGQFLHAVR